jgi:hypothetical protein
LRVDEGTVLAPPARVTSVVCKCSAAATFALTIAGALGCAVHDEAIDPDGRAHPTREERAAADARVREVSLRAVVAAVAGVPAREAPETLARWLHDAGPGAWPLLARWPRRDDGALDLDRAPVLASTIEGEIAPRGKSRCGRLAVVFRGDDAPALRFRLEVPATSAACRGAKRDVWIRDAEALPALDDAIRAASVPDVDAL